MFNRVYIPSISVFSVSVCFKLDIKHSVIKYYHVCTVYQAAQDALQSARAIEGGSNPVGSRSSQESVTSPPPSPPSDSNYDETADDSGWIYTDHPRQSDQ